MMRPEPVIQHLVNVTLPADNIMRTYLCSWSGKSFEGFITGVLRCMMNNYKVGSPYRKISGSHKKTVMPEFRLVGLLRSEEHTSELQSRENLVCRLLLEKKD